MKSARSLLDHAIEILSSGRAAFQKKRRSERLFNRSFSLESLEQRTLMSAAPNDPIAHWTFDETSGTVAADVTSYANDAVLGPVGSEPVWSAGENGGALAFDGVNDQAKASDLPVDLSPGGKNTVAFWMKWDGGDMQMPVALGYHDLWIRDGRFGFNTYAGDHLAINDFTVAEYGNKWIHVTAVFANPDTSRADWQTVRAANSKLYINGVEQTLTQIGTPSTYMAKPMLTLGAGPGGFHFAGALDDMRVYARELTSQEVAALAEGANSAPTARDDGPIAADQATAVTVDVLANDRDVDGTLDPLSVSVVSNPSNGTTEVLPDGKIRYTPDAGFIGIDTLRYTVNDNDGAASEEATLTIVVVEGNDAPEAVDDAYRTNSGGLNVSAPGVLENDTDVNGDTLTAELATAPAHGSLTLNADGSFNYTPAAGFIGTDSFMYRASDGVVDSLPATVSIVVEGTGGDLNADLVAHWNFDETTGAAADATPYGNDAVLNPAGSEPVREQGVSGEALLFDGVEDFARATDVPVDVSPGGKNTVAFWMKWDGGDKQMPVAMGYYNLYIRNGRFGFNTYGGDHLSIGDFTVANYGNRWIHVTAVFPNRDTSLADWRADLAANSKLYINGVEQTLTQIGKPSSYSMPKSTMTLGAGPGGFYFAGALDDVRVYSRELTSQEAAVLAGGVSSTPVAYDDGPIATTEATAVTVDVLGNDQDADGLLDPLSVSVVSNPSNGAAEVLADGRIYYTPDAGFIGIDTFRYTVRDNDGALSNEATVTVRVSAMNDAPEATDDSYRTDSGGLNVNAPGVLANDSDVNGDSLTSLLDTGPAHGTLTLNADGSFSYVPNAGYVGTDSFTYLANDGIQNSLPATVNILVEAVNKPPTAYDDTYRTASGVLTVNAPGVLGNDSDVNGDSLTSVLVTGPAHGSLTLNADGSFSYVPDVGYVGTDRFTYLSNDGTADSLPATVNITIDDGRLPGLVVTAEHGKVLGIPSDYQSGDKITLTTEADAGYRFAAWYVDGIATKDSSLTLTMNGDKSVTAYFVADDPLIRVAVSQPDIAAQAKNPQPGMTLYLAPGIYTNETGEWTAVLDGIHGTENQWVTVTALDPTNKPVLRGDRVGVHAADASYLKISNLRVEDMVDIGIHLAVPGSAYADWSYDKLNPTHHIVVENCEIVGTGSMDWGNHDSIKISGVDYFEVRGLYINGWGDGAGSAMDIVNSQYGLIEDNELTYPTGSGTTFGITVKGGSRYVEVRNNLFDRAGSEPMQIGQDSGLQVFRDGIGATLANGDILNYEAKYVEVHDNVIIGGKYSVYWMKSQDTYVHNNTIIRPPQASGSGSIFKFTNSTHDGVLPAQDALVENNLIVYWYSALETWYQPFCRAYPGAQPDLPTLKFNHNAWWQMDVSEAGLHLPDTVGNLGLPNPETNPIYQVDPELAGVDYATGEISPYDIRIQSSDPRLQGIGAGAAAISPAMDLYFQALAVDSLNANDQQVQSNTTETWQGTAVDIALMYDDLGG